MKTKNKIGALVILGGIALLGYVYFKKNKPTVASSQLKGLEALSNYYESGSGGREETLIAGTGYTPSKPADIINLVNLSTKELESIKNSIEKSIMYDPSSQIAENMKNVDFSNLNTGLAGINFDNFKIK